MKGANALGSHMCHLGCLTVGTLHSALRGKGRLSTDPTSFSCSPFCGGRTGEVHHSCSYTHTHLGGRAAREEKCRRSQKVQGRLLGRRAAAGPEGTPTQVTLTSPLRGDHICSQSDLSNCWVRCSKSHTRLLDVLLVFCVFAASPLCRETMTHQADVLAVSQVVLPHLLPS